MPSLLCCPNFTSIHDYWKNHTLTIWTSVGNVMSLLFNTLSRFVIVSNKRQTTFHCMTSVTVCSNLEPKKKNSVAVSIFSPSVYHEVMGLNAVILVFWMLSFKPALSLSSFTLIKRLFSSSSFSAIRVISSACLRLLISLPTILFKPVIHPVQHFSWCTLHVS